MAGDNSGKVILGLGLLALAGGGTFLGYKYLTKNTSSTTSSTSTPITSSYTPVLTTINWNANATNLPSTGGSITFTIQALDQNNNPIAGVSPTLMESEVIGTTSGYSPQGVFPATNTSGMSSLSLTVPANPNSSSVAMVFTLGGV